MLTVIGCDDKPGIKTLVEVTQSRYKARRIEFRQLTGGQPLVQFHVLRTSRELFFPNLFEAGHRFSVSIPRPTALSHEPFLP